MQYLLTSELPIGPIVARIVKVQEAHFVIIDDILYKHTFFMLLLRYLSP